MPSYSNATVLGYIGNEVELKRGQKANYLNLSIGVTRAFKTGKDWKTKTRWLKVMFFGQYAIIAADKLSKGDLVLVTGDLEVNEYTKAGIKTYETYILGRHVTAITTKNKDKLDHNYGIPDDEIESPFM